jgi:hypothetical protein
MTRSGALTAAAAVATTAIAVVSWRVAALPVGSRVGGAAWTAAYWTALAVLILTWLLLGRLVLSERAAAAALRRYVLAAATPLSLAAPFGRDLWAYAAQGNLVRHGIDAYAHGPAALPGAFTAQVSPRWVTSASPYGPIWLQLCHGAVTLSGGHPLLAVLLLRLPAFAGLAFWLWALPRLTRRLSSRWRAGLWLGAASPLTLVLGVGGGHNDLLMIGLMLAGLAVATGPGRGALAGGAALACLAGLVKAPAMLGVAFTVLVWLHANGLPRTGRRVAAASGVAGAAAASVGVAVTVAAGLGVGWVWQLRGTVRWASWQSAPSALAMLVHTAAGEPPGALDATMRDVRQGGTVLCTVAVAALWLAARRRAPLACLTLALGAVVVLAPMVQPWYYDWPLALAALVVVRRARLAMLAAVPVAFTVLVEPSGQAYLNDWAATLTVIAGALLLTRLVLVRSQASVDGRVHEQPDLVGDFAARDARVMAVRYQLW